MKYASGRLERAKVNLVKRLATVKHVQARLANMNANRLIMEGQAKAHLGLALASKEAERLESFHVTCTHIER